jgi:hypothetical protein
MHTALKLSDVLHGIFRQLENDTRSLLASALVCKTWATEVKPILWRHPTTSALAALPPQQQERAAAIASGLTIDKNVSDSAAAALLEALDFPRLTTLCLRNDSVPAAQFKRRHAFFQEFNDFRVRCDDTLLEFLQTCVETGLRSVYIRQGVCASVFALLAGLPNLEQLHLYSGVPDSAMAEAAPVPSPFPRLRQLHANAGYRTIPGLVPLISSVHHLRLALTARDIFSLSHVETLRNLVSLKLVFLGRAVLEWYNVVNLGSIATLEVLELLSPKSQETDLNDDTILQWAAGLSRLRRLVIDLSADLTVKMLVGVGSRCRVLEYLSLSNTIKLQDLEMCVDSHRMAVAAANSDDYHSSEGNFILFPELQFLKLLGVTNIITPPDLDPRSVASRLLRGLHRHAPKLRKLLLPKYDSVLSKYYPIDTAVSDLWRRRRRS